MILNKLLGHLTSLVTQMVKPTMWETWVQSLGWEDLEKEMATHSSILAWKIPWTEEPGRLQSMGLQGVRHDFTFTLGHLRIINMKCFISLSFMLVVVVQLPCHVQIFVTPWTAAFQASLLLIISQSLPRFMSIELVILLTSQFFPSRVLTVAS